MKLLAIDASTPWLSLALCTSQNTLAIHKHVEQQHTKWILPDIAHLLQQAALTLTELDAIIFGQGPGSFTGLRLACGLAQGLAFAAGIPVIAIPTLDNIAYQAGQGCIMVCMDARMRQVYHAIYDIGQEWRLLHPPQVTVPDQIKIPDRVTCLAGNGFQLYPELVARAPNIPCLSTLQPHALAHIKLTQSCRYPLQSAEATSLLYVRNKVALTTLEQQAIQVAK